MKIRRMASSINARSFVSFASSGRKSVEDVLKVRPTRRRVVGAESGEIDLGSRSVEEARRFSRRIRKVETNREGRKAGSYGEKVGPKRKPHFRLYALPRNSRISLIIRGTWAKVARARASFPSRPFIRQITREGF